MHAAPSDDLKNISLASGTYLPAKTFAEGTFNPEYSTWVATDKEGRKSGEGFVVDGKVEVENSGDVYAITARIRTASGMAFEVAWKGTIEWWNMIPGGEAHYARGYYFGRSGSFFTNPDDPDSDFWTLQIADKYPNTTWALNVSFFTEKASDLKNPVPPDGTYTIKPDQSTTPGSMLPGIDGEDMGTYMTSRFDGWFLTSGEMTLTIDDGQYTIVCTATDDKGHKADVTYSGAIEIENRYTPPIERDIEVTFDRVCGEEGRYYGEVHAVCKYQICLADGQIAEWWSPEPALPGVELYFQQFTLYSATPPTTADFLLPEGVYTLSEEYADLVCDPYDTFIYHWDMDGFKKEVWFTTGTVEVEHTEAGYRIVLDATGEEGNTVRTTYEGAIPMHNSSGVPLPARKRRGITPRALLPTVHDVPENGQRFSLYGCVLR